MAVKEGNNIEMGTFKPYFTKRPSFSLRRAKTKFSEHVLTSIIEPSNERKKAKINSTEHVVCNGKPSNGKLISSTQIGCILTDRLSMMEERPDNTRPYIINISTTETKQGNEKSKATENDELQTSKTMQTNCTSQLHCAYLDYLKTWDPYTGEPCSDPEARLNEIIEEMKSWESDVEDFSKRHGQDNPKLSCTPILKTSEHNVDIFGNSSKDVNKIKVDCPNCKKNVVAVRFVPHLSKCMGVHGRRSTRKTRK